LPNIAYPSGRLLVLEEREERGGIFFVCRGGAANEIAETWQCRVDDTARVATKAGDFDTFRVTCSLVTEPAGAALTRTFFYAPAIDYYVRREDRTGTGETETITLTAYMTAEPPLPADAARTRAAVRQTALETVPSGEAMPWRDAASGTSGTVRLVSTMRSARRGWRNEVPGWWI